MVNLQKYENKKIAIYGMGLTGFSVTKALRKLKAKVYCWDDDKKVRKKIKRLNFPLFKFWTNKKFIDYIVISPGIDINTCNLKNYLKKNLNKTITDLDLFFEFNKDVKIISITGTNGKSTTCKIVEKILKTANYNVKTIGNIGNPVLSLKKGKKKYICVLEVSSYQLQYSKLFRSQHAAILNISTDHLDRHKNLINYTKVKSKIFFGQKKSDWSYINVHNKYFSLIKNIFKKKKLKSNLVFIDKSSCNSLVKKINNKYFNNDNNLENLAFAYKIAKNFKIKDKIIVEAVNKFKSLPHRQEIIFSNNKFICINDSKATSFDASLQSLNNNNKIYWIVGGIPKNQDSFNLKKISKKIVKAYIIGKHTSFFVNQIKNDIPYQISHNLKNAIFKILKDIQNKKEFGFTILLSPAAASFDQFKNFEDRGEQFKKLLLKKIKKQYV